MNDTITPTEVTVEHDEFTTSDFTVTSLAPFFGQLVVLEHFDYEGEVVEFSPGVLELEIEPTELQDGTVVDELHLVLATGRKGRPVKVLLENVVGIELAEDTDQLEVVATLGHVETPDSPAALEGLGAPQSLVRSLRIA